MKLSNNSIGMLIFFALATVVFVLMALRPAVEGSAMNLGVPINSEVAAVDKTIESTATTATEPSSAETTEAATEDEQSSTTEEAVPEKMTPESTTTN